MGIGTRIILLVVGAFWISLVGVADWFLGYSMFRQVRAQNFATAHGVVTHSEVTHGHGSKGGKTYGVDIRYTYAVDDHRFEGKTFRYGSGSSSDSKWAHEAVAKYRSGAEIAVRYDAANPVDSVLEIGISGSELFILMFLLPFNAIGIAILSAPVRWAWRLFGAPFQRHPEVGGFRWIVEWDGRTRVRLVQFPALAWALATSAAVGFLSVFVVGFGLGGFHPSLTIMVANWAIILLAGIATFVWHSQQQASGRYDLVFDPAARTVEVPGHLPKTVIEAAKVHRVEVGSKTTWNKGRSSTTYLVKLIASAHWTLIDGMGDKAKADALAAAVREKVAATATGQS